jgi:hypothetical protein
MKNTIIILATIFCMFSCEGFLDPDPRDRYAVSDIWKSEEGVRLYLNSFYASLRDYTGFGNNSMGVYEHNTDGLTDILKYGSTVPGAGSCNVTATQEGDITPNQNSLDIWTSGYNRIRRVNEFLFSLEQYGKNISPDTKKEYVAEAKFFRAYIYYLLVKRHSSVVLYDELPNTLNDNPQAGAQKNRSPEKECWDFIIKDLEDATKDLPTKSEVSVGRVTKGAAYGLLNRVALYSKEWQKVLDTEIELKKLGYGLVANYADNFKQKGAANKETILAVHYKKTDLVHKNDERYAPASDVAGYGGLACPTAEMVDEYELSDGTDFDWDDASMSLNPYSNREPRFYASILYNGADWKGRKIETFVGGADGFVQYGVEDLTHKTVTGYYMKKYVDETNLDFHQTHSDVSWVEIRYAEILLNKAEALANQTKFGDAVIEINKLRTRVGLPGISYSDEDQFWKDYRHERKVELAFENQWYWDLRRWRLAHTQLNDVRFHGTKITKSGDVLTYEKVECDNADRYFSEKYYTLPIPAYELKNNKACEQIDVWK